MLPTLFSRWTTFVCLCAAISTGFAEPKEAESIDILQIYRDLKQVSIDGSRTVHLRNVEIKRDRATFRFGEGVLYLLKPVSGRVTGAVFLGDVFFHLKPPTEIERYQMRRFLESDSLEQSFSAVYLRFSDDTDTNFLAGLDFSERHVPDEARELVRKMNAVLLEEQNINLHSRITADLVNVRKGLFFAAFPFYEEKLNFPSYFLFNVDHDANEEVAAFQFFPHRANKAFYTLCAFDQERDPGNGASKDSFEIRHYDLDIHIEKSGHASVKAKVNLLPNVKGLYALSFDLFHKLKIDSVRSASGDSLAFVNEEKEGAFSVFVSESLAVGQPAELTVFYSGNLLRNADGNYLLNDNLNWYPRSGYLNPATYAITYHYPRSLSIVSTGRQQNEWQTQGEKHALWVEETPSLAAAFGLGNFVDLSLYYDDSLRVNVFSTKHRSRNVRKKIAGDVASSLYFFQTMLGSYPYSQLNVIETPNRVSNGYPGTLFLTSLTFEVELEGVMQELRGHEVSHQWWGNLVGWKSYHDQWLSEGLAEYSGALMNQFLLDGDNRFLQTVAGWRNDLIDKGHIGVSLGLRRFGFSKADLAQSDGLQAGPIWLGNRLGAKYAVDYYLNVYEKAAYVVHMLRIMLRDFETGSDARFWRMLRDYVQTFKGRKASTEDFQRVVDHHFQQDMSWFFQQWIYGVDIPQYGYSYSTVSEGGSYFIEMKIEQEKVPPTFQAFIPVTIKFAGKERTERVQMFGASRDFRFGPFPAPPEQVTFNAWGGVLARVRSK